MQTQSVSANLYLDSAFVSDRGLSPKRPLNEDSYLNNRERGIFAVADGVGGAQAGEVASSTAVEVLQEAFQHQTADSNIENLMRQALQHANNAIYQMSHEKPQLAAMATTIVALHLDPARRRAIFGHVGDSRLYRLLPTGELMRETLDHSIVEEEVRAGRMTPEQAQHHPSRNVISRALGAEAAVEADLQNIELEENTVFLLCSDGVTRHISDGELRDLLASKLGASYACSEIKRLCLERGAEDNFTAVIVRVHRTPNYDAAEILEDDEATIATVRPGFANADTQPLSLQTVSQNAARPPDLPPGTMLLTDAEHYPNADLVVPHIEPATDYQLPPALPVNAAVTQALTAAEIQQINEARQNARVEAAEVNAKPEEQVIVPPTPVTVVAAPPKRGSIIGKFFALLFILLGIVAAFAAGLFVGNQRVSNLIGYNVPTLNQPTAQPQPTPNLIPITPVVESNRLANEIKKVDADPQGWIASAFNNNPPTKPYADTGYSAEKLFLYGRALIRQEKYPLAEEVLTAAHTRATGDSPELRALRREITLTTLQNLSKQSLVGSVTLKPQHKAMLDDATEWKTPATDTPNPIKDNPGSAPQ